MTIELEYANVYLVEKIHSGKRVILHKKRKKVKICDAEEKNITKNHKELALEAQKMSDFDFILDGKINNGRFYVFDILYFNDRSLQSLRLYERKKVLASLEWSENIKKVSSFVVYNAEELKKSVKAVSSLPNSKGAMVKSLLGTYSENASWMEFRKDEGKN